MIKYLDAFKQELRAGDIIESIITGEVYELIKDKEKQLRVVDIGTNKEIVIDEFGELLEIKEGKVLVGYMVHMRSKGRKIRRK